jgi:DNA-binding protein YbaB
MFNKLKQIKDLRSQAKTMQNMLAQETVTVEKDGVKLTMNGNMEVTSLEFPEGKPSSELSAPAASAFNAAIKKVQRIMAEKMRSMGGFPGM